MIHAKVVALPTAALLAGCAQNMPAAYRPPDLNSVTPFTLSLTPNCWQVQSGMDRPTTMTVQNDSGEQLISDGIHYGLSLMAPNGYAGGDWIKIRADLASRPKTLMVRTDDGRCVWTASVP